jgi:hypothetical protein
MVFFSATATGLTFAYRLRGVKRWLARDASLANIF